MTEPAAAKLRLSCPGDLVEAVPYLLGFHPQGSLVALALRGNRRRVVFTMRLDLPGGDADVTEVAAGVAAYIENARAEQAVLVTYGAPAQAGDRLPHQDLVLALRAALADRGIEVVDSLHVASDRWWSYDCTDPRCCPPEGTPLAAQSCSTVAAAATYAGLVALPSREALEQTLEPVGILAAEGVHRALERAALDLGVRGHSAADRASVRQESMKLLRSAVDGARQLSDDEVARLIVGLQDVQVRDACCAWATSSRADGARLLWTTLARRSGPPWNTVPLCLVAWFAYLAGDATLAAVAIERCLRSDPSYHLALLLQQALQRAVDPARFRAHNRAFRGLPVGRRHH